MKTWSKKRKILLGLLLLVLLAQAIQPPKNNGQPFGPRDLASVVAVPDSIQTMLQRSCYDCHSDYTNYPWYDHITPVNWWVAHHINEGKGELNFTHFGEYEPRKAAKKLDETAELIENGEMPLHSYLWMHRDAALTPAQKAALLQWTKTAHAQLQP